MKKRKISIIVILLLLIALFLMMTMPLLTQEHHTISVLVGIVKLSSDRDIVKYDEDDSFQYYISKTNNGNQAIVELMLKSDFIFSNQMGAGYVFTDSNNDENSIVVAGRQFTQNYQVWQVPINDEN